MKLKLARLFIYLGIWLLLFPSAAMAQKEELKLEILNGHSGGGVLSVAVSHDGKFALTGSTDQTALLWDLATGKQLRRFTGHEAAIRSVSFSPDDQLVLTAGDDGIAYLWETATGRRVRGFKELRNGVLIGHSGAILSAAISADGKLIATAGADKTARIWDLQTGKQLFQIEHEGRVNSIAFSPDSKYLLTGGEDKIARLLSTSSGELVRQFVGHTGEIMSVAYSPNGKEILTGGKYIGNGTLTFWQTLTDNYDVDTGTLLLWNADSGAKIKEFKFLDIVNIVFNSGGDKFIATDGNRCKMFDNNLNKGVVLEGCGDSIALITDDKQILSNSKNNYQLTIFDVKTKDEIKKIEGKSDIVNKIEVSTNSKFLPIGANGNTSGLWNLYNGALLKFKLETPQRISQNFSPATPVFTQIGFSKSPSNSKTDKKYNSFLGVVCNGVCDDESSSYAISISPDERKVVFSNKSTYRIFDLQTLKQEKYFEIVGTISSDIRQQGISFTNFSPNGKYLLVGGSNGANLINLDDQTVLDSSFLEKPYDALFSPNSKLIAAVKDDPLSWKSIKSKLILWEIGTNNIEKFQNDFTAPIWSVAFSPDGKTIAAASGGEIDVQTVGIGNAAQANGVRFFDVETGRETDGFGGEFQFNSNKFSGFKSVAYSPDGKYLAAGAFDGKVYLRDNQTKELRKFEGHTDAVNSVKFAKDADGNLLVVSGSSDSTTRIWNAATGEEICALVTFRDGNWAVVQTKTGRYDAPNGGEIDGIQWVYGTETIELKQLSAMYYTPNLLPRLLGYNKDPLTAVVPLKDIKLFPEVVEQKFDARTNRLNLKLKSRGGGIGKTEIYAGGKLTGKDGKTTETEKLVVEDARDEKLKQNPNVADGAVVSLSVELPAGSFVAGGENQIKVVTSNYLKEIGKGNIQSRGSQIVYLDEGKEDLQLPTLYAIVGGVSDYAGEDLKLRFAAKDAEDFSNALKLGAKRLFGVDKVNVTTLSTERKAASEQPTKENFKRAVEDIAKKARPEDIVLIYLSGHGVTLGGGTDTYFYLTKDARSTSKTDLETNFQTVAISNAELVDWLTPDKDKPDDIYIKALKQVVILDTCAAGSFAAEDWRKDREGLTGDQIRAMEFLKDKTGTFVLMGSAANAVSYEANTYNQGLLTYSLLEGMKGLALQKPTENIDVRLLFDYAEKRVPELAKTMNLDQRPLIKQPSGNTFVIGQMTGAETAQITIPQPKPLMLRPLLTAPPLGNDPLKLIPQLGKLLDAESSYAVVRQRGEKEPKLIYIDDDTFPGAVRVTGTYSVTGETVKVKAYLVRDETVLAELPEIVSTKEKVLDELLKIVRDQMAKIEFK